MKKIVMINIVVLLIKTTIFSQELIKPNFAIASHPMKVEKISNINDFTIIELSIENQVNNGYFCADKNIILRDILNGKEYKLIKSEGISVCPDSYKFTYVGEVLRFKLYFLKIDKSVKYIDIIENCNANCFYIKGVVLDKKLNNNIDTAYEYYKKDKLDFSLAAFRMVANNSHDYPYGLFHYNIAQIYAEKKDFKTAKKWYEKIINSDFKDKKELILRIKSEEYYNKLK